MKRGTNSANFVKIAQGIRGVYMPKFGNISVKFSVFWSYTLIEGPLLRAKFHPIGATGRPCEANNLEISL